VLDPQRERHRITPPRATRRADGDDPRHLLLVWAWFGRIVFGMGGRFLLIPVPVVLAHCVLLVLLVGMRRRTAAVAED
jgi:hypothetical protein